MILRDLVETVGEDCLDFEIRMCLFDRTRGSGFIYDEVTDFDLGYFDKIITLS